MVVMCAVGKSFLHFYGWVSVFSEILPLDCEVHKCFSVPPLSLVGTEWLECVRGEIVFLPHRRSELAGVGCFLSPRSFRP